MEKIEKDKWYVCHTQFGLCDVGFKVKYADYINKNGFRFVDENGMYYSIRFDEIEKYFKPIEVKENNIKENNMTTEEKAKRFDEALEQLKGLIEGTREDKCAITEEDIIDIFPELKESEDEKIRNALIKYLKCRISGGDFSMINNITINDMLAWLERQKPAKWTEEDEENLLVCKNALTAGQYAESISTWLDEKIKLPKSDNSEITRLKGIVAKLKIMISQSKGFNRNNRDKVFELLDSLLNITKI